MTKNNLKIAWRNLVKNRLFAFINIGGLAAGMAVAMLIACWIYSEWSYDRQCSHFRQIAQVWEIWPDNKGAQYQLPIPVADVLRSKFAGNFKQILLSSKTQEHVLAFKEEKLVRTGNFIEPAGPEMFTIPMLQGSWSGLHDPHSILLSASLAKSLFGNNDPVGQVLHMDDSLPVTVTGVYRDFPYNSSFRDISFLAPWALYEYFDGETHHNKNSWGDNNWQIFVQMADNTDLNKVSEKIKTIKADYDPWPDAKGVNQNTTKLFLHPMSRWHLYSEFKDGDSDSGKIRYIRLFGMIGFFVLLLACINFMNLSTARSEKRAREVGIRKTVGSLRRQLIWQFYSESVLVSFLALIIALGLLRLSIPLFDALAETQLIIPWSTPLWWIGCIGFSLLTGIIAGSYPALYLSSFKPVSVLKGIYRAGRMASLPRKALVVVQFTVSISMITGTLIVFRQVRFARERPVGYDREGLIMLQLHTNEIHNHFAAFRNELIASGAVAEIAQSISPLTASWPFNGGLTWSGHGKNMPGDPDFSMKGVSMEYAQTTGMKFVEGRNFRTGPEGADGSTMIINEATKSYLGLKDPIGKTIQWQGSPFTIIGIVKNIVMESPYEKPVPAMFYLSPGNMSNLTIRINPHLSAPEALSRISPLFARYNPAEPFDYQFVDDEFDAKFRVESKVGWLTLFFTGLAIFISCLGIFGLASFVAEQRTREIGLRKVLGATVFNLWKMLSKDFVLLVTFSCVIAVPISWWVLSDWLHQFPYRTEISGWIFVAATCGAVLITLLTVSYQGIKVALSNPARSLRVK